MDAESVVFCMTIWELDAECRNVRIKNYKGHAENVAIRIQNWKMDAENAVFRMTIQKMDAERRNVRIRNCKINAENAGIRMGNPNVDREGPSGSWFRGGYRKQACR